MTGATFTPATRGNGGAVHIDAEGEQTCDRTAQRRGRSAFSLDCVRAVHTPGR